MDDLEFDLPEPFDGGALPIRNDTSPKSDEQKQAQTTPEAVSLTSPQATSDTGPLAALPAIPSGHPEVKPGQSELTCPFAMIQMALESNMQKSDPSAQPASPSKAEPQAKHARTKSTTRASDVLQNFHPTVLSDDDFIPEGMSTALAMRERMSRSLQEESDSGKSGSPKRSDADMGPAPPRPGREAERTQSSARLELDDDDGASHMPSKAGRSSYSRGSRSSRMSRMTKKTQHKRTRQAPTFSTWEAQTYIPIIKSSWDTITGKMTVDEVGLRFYDLVMENAPQEVKNMFTSERTLQAKAFANLLNQVVVNADDPHAIYTKLKGLAPMHLEKGVSKDHLPIMGSALFKLLESILEDHWSDKIKAAWDWIWTWMGNVMAQTLEECGNNLSVVTQSWDLANDNCPDEQLGVMLFDVLFEMAPNLRSVFSKPREVLSLKFCEMMGTLVSFQNKLGDSEEIEQMEWLGLRHIKYGAKREHVDVLGQVLLTTMERAVGEEGWTEEMCNAWTSLWTSTCDKLLSITELADEHGERVRQMWARVKSKSNNQQFGAALRKKLLAGTEWVQTLSVGATSKTSHDGSESPGPKRASATKSNESFARTPSFDEKSSDAEAIGNQFWDMLTDSLNLLWDPEQQNEKLTIMTHKFFQWGIRSNHLDVIGSGIKTTSSKILGSEWNEKYEKAWDWFWEMTAKSMARTLKILEGEHASQLRASWERCKGKMPSEELGDLFFKELARLAPHVVHLFKKPRRIQANQFVGAVEMLVSFAEDPEDFFEKLRPLTIRHIKYGVKAEYSKAFGGCIIGGVAKCLGDEFDASIRAAWLMLWERCSSIVTRALNAGTNLVIVGIVNQDVERLAEAVACAPRGERVDTLTRVDVNGEILSPLYWAINDGMREIAVFLIHDLLEIRADRETYYYGREQMFKTHPDIVQVLCKDPGASELLDTLLNGLMWHAHAVHEGKIRVNYYMKEMFGDPEEQPNVWETGLGVLAVSAPAETFDHPFTIKLLETKWNRFGKMVFAGVQFFYVALTVMYVLGFVIFAEECGPWKSLRYATGGLAIVLLTPQFVLIIKQVRMGQVSRQYLTWPSWLGTLIHFLPASIATPRYLMNSWNTSRIPALLLVAIATFSVKCGEGRRAGSDAEEFSIEWYDVISAAACLVLCMQLLELTLLVPSMAALTVFVNKLTPGVLRMMVVLMILLISIAGALSVIREPHFDTFGDAIVGLWKIFIAQGNSHMDGLSDFALVLVAVFLVVADIALLNMLVAQFVHFSAETMHSAILLVRQRIAYTCVEMESILPLWYKKKIYTEMKFDEPLDFDTSDHGPGGGIVCIEPASVRSHPKYVPDRIQRFTGEASAADPWPRMNQEHDENE